MRDVFKYNIFALIPFCCGFLSSCSVNEEIVPNDPACDRSFAVFSDVQQGYGVYSKLAKNIAEIRPVPILAVCCGDLMLRAANEAEWEEFYSCSKSLTDITTLLLARGNHEGTDPFSEQVLREKSHFPDDVFYYTYTIEDCRFIILDTQDREPGPGISDTQVSWLKIQLDQSSKDTVIKHIFVFMHQPVFVPGDKIAHLDNSDELHSIFLGQDKLKAVFSGHFHLFNKNNIDGINYIITGGGGGKLRRGYGGDYHHFTKISFYRNPDRINLKTIGMFNEVIEDFDL